MMNLAELPESKLPELKEVRKGVFKIEFGGYMEIRGTLNLEKPYSVYSWAGVEMMRMVVKPKMFSTLAEAKEYIQRFS